MTRAASHLKSALKAAKLAANKKLRMVGRKLPAKRDYTALSKIVSRRKKEKQSKTEKKKKLSIESTSSKSSISK